jgi:hypothetical protein
MAVLGAVLAVLAVVAVVGFSTTERGRSAIEQSDGALAAGDVTTAIERARDAAMAVFPGSPYPEQGFVRLTAIGDAAEARGDFAEALFAWRAVRVALIATRREAADHLRLVAANQATVRLAGRACEGAETRSAQACAKLTASVLAEQDLPALSTFALLGLGAAVFLVAAARAAWRPSGSLPWAAAAVVGAVLCALALGR